jgi:hypothetical protein
MAGDARDRPATFRDISVVVVVIFVGLFLTSFTVLGALFLTLTPDGEFALFILVSVTLLGVFAGWSLYLEAGDRRWSTARERASLPPGGVGRSGSADSEGPAREGMRPYSERELEHRESGTSPSGPTGDRPSPP